MTESSLPRSAPGQGVLPTIRDGQIPYKSPIIHSLIVQDLDKALNSPEVPLSQVEQTKPINGSGIRLYISPGRMAHGFRPASVYRRLAKRFWNRFDLWMMRNPKVYT